MQLELIRRWLAGETVHIEGVAYVFPHGARQVRAMLGAAMVEKPRPAWRYYVSRLYGGLKVR